MATCAVDWDARSPMTSYSVYSQTPLVVLLNPLTIPAVPAELAYAYFGHVTDKPGYNQPDYSIFKMIYNDRKTNKERRIVIIQIDNESGATSFVHNVKCFIQSCRNS